MYSLTEENYLKAIYKIQETESSVTTNAIAEVLETRAASVTDMLKRLAEKKLIRYEKYHGVVLLAKGKKIAIQVIRKHRLWEVFLSQKLHFAWDQVHEVAEQLEHIHSELLIDKLDEFLGFPRFDPHGDPIPDKQGQFEKNNFESLAESKVGKTYIVSGVTEYSKGFLQTLDKLHIRIGSSLTVKSKQAYDGSMEITLEGEKPVVLSQQINSHIYVRSK